MSYNYTDLRPKLFTEDGQVLFLEMRDRAKKIIAHAGAARMDAIMQGSTGDTWLMLACVDRMVELGELKEVPSPSTAGQYRIFTMLP